MKKLLLSSYVLVALMAAFQIEARSSKYSSSEGFGKIGENKNTWSPYSTKTPKTRKESYPSKLGRDKASKSSYKAKSTVERTSSAKRSISGRSVKPSRTGN